MTSTTTGIFDITGKRALVTGASRGIGRAIAIALAEAGAHVVAAARTEKALKETAALAADAPGQIDILATDLRTPESAEAAIHCAAETLGGLDILVNNAADDHDSSIEETDLKVYQRVMDLNLQSCWVMTKAASPYLKDGGGKVINIASVLGLVGMLDDSVYIAAKHGLIGLTKAVALEWARAGVQVNAIAPGFVDTAMIGNLKENEALQAYVKKKTPMGRAAQPEEYAGPTVFLASSASDFMTGQVLVVDGGYSTQ
ncbi:2-dehydro-3-deoxy-D-gluconate 5-dehydrogenase [Streptomyces sp. RB17]|uniref:SDR family NAD(P)-dependent oxidoreductase n=1 Tax=Streptomyces sp. RB17 TaxID=2585197 RepID=UPI0012959547|nr:SDR family oxidoreductase [Streptomyces sp. RB17]MQY33853.1 2-dehydro-3-deoxy-D-gluconate 5-dehydrogenase [Streptomyces sp. RB17]